MKNSTKVLASIGTVMIPISAAYFTTGIYLHQKLIDFQNTNLGHSLEHSLEGIVANPENGIRVGGTIIIALGLCKLAYEIACPLAEKVAHCYGARLN